MGMVTVMLAGSHDESDWREFATQYLTEWFGDRVRVLVVPRRFDIDPVSPALITRLCLQHISRADAVLARWSEAPSIGTAMEVAWAFQCNIPVYAVNAPDHLMLRGAVETFADVTGALDAVCCAYSDFGG